MARAVSRRRTRICMGFSNWKLLQYLGFKVQLQCIMTSSPPKKRHAQKSVIEDVRNGGGIFAIRGLLGSIMGVSVFVGNDEMDACCGGSNAATPFGDDYNMLGYIGRTPSWETSISSPGRVPTNHSPLPYKASHP